MFRGAYGHWCVSWKLSSSNIYSKYINMLGPPFHGSQEAPTLKVQVFKRVWSNWGLNCDEVENRRKTSLIKCLYVSINTNDTSYTKIEILWTRAFCGAPFINRQWITFIVLSKNSSKRHNQPKNLVNPWRILFLNKNKNSLELLVLELDIWQVLKVLVAMHFQFIKLLESFMNLNMFWPMSQ